MADTIQVAASRSSSRDKTLPLGFPANEEEDVFIPLESSVKLIKSIVAIKKGHVTFIRAPVAAGKTTLAKYLATKHDADFVMAKVVELKEEMEQNIIKAIHDSCDIIVEGSAKPTLNDALEALGRSEKTLILDEAHIIFSMESLIFSMFKAPESWVRVKPPKILLFSAAAEAKTESGDPIGTPAEILKKYMWYPPVPDTAILSNNLAAAEVFLDSESVDFFMKICSGHRGIFMHAMEWVQEAQEKQTQEESNMSLSTRTWNIHESVSRVKSSFTRSKQESDNVHGWGTGLRSYIRNSRAVKVNGRYSTISNIPSDFAKVLFGGPQTRQDLGENVRALTIGGFLVPERTRIGHEFVAYNWDKLEQRFGITNSFMAEYYGDVYVSDLKYKREYTKKTPQTAADLIARALPFMSFATVIDNPLPNQEGEGSDEPLSQSTAKLKSPKSSDALPYEDDYNDALAAALGNLGYTVSRPKDPTTGKTDVVVTYGGSKTCALESLMATRPLVSHDEHKERFGNASKPTYYNATLKGLITIGSKKETILQRLNGMSCTKGTEGLEVIGLVLSAAHDAYEMYVRPSLLEDAIQGPFFLVCDRVAKSLDPNAASEQHRVVAASRLQTQTPEKRSNQDTVSNNSSQKKLKSE